MGKTIKECSCTSQDNGLYDLGCPIHDDNIQMVIQAQGSTRSQVIAALIEHAKALGW